MSLLIKFSFYLLLLALTTSFVYGQANSEEGSWEKIVIKDQLFGSFFNKYSILNSGTTEHQIISIDNDSLIGTISDQEISEVIRSLKLETSLEFNSSFHDDPLLIFQRDSNWYYKNYQKLWKKFKRKENIKLKRKGNKVAIKGLSEYSRVSRIIWYMNGANSEEFPMVDVLVKYANDSIRIQATSPDPYMMNWYDFKTKLHVYSSDISLAVSRIYKIKGASNRERLNGVNFNHIMMKRIYDKCIEFDIRSYIKQ